MENLLASLSAVYPLLTMLVQGIFRSNFLVFGVSIITSLYGVERLAPTVLLAAVTIPLMNGLSVVALENFRGGKPSIRHLLVSMAKNLLLQVRCWRFCSGQSISTHCREPRAALLRWVRPLLWWSSARPSR